ncbi:MAG: hypothetical protein ACI4DU_10570 [Lachnospiraceae bacterium]
MGIDSVELAKSRIAYRVEHGGHGIPDADVERRYAESLRQLKKILGECNRVIMYDNTVCFRRFAVYEEHREHVVSNDIPRWYKEWKNSKTP